MKTRLRVTISLEAAGEVSITQWVLWGLSTLMSTFNSSSPRLLCVLIAEMTYSSPLSFSTLYRITLSCLVSSPWPDIPPAFNFPYRVFIEAIVGTALSWSRKHFSSFSCLQFPLLGLSDSRFPWVFLHYVWRDVFYFITYEKSTGCVLHPLLHCRTLYTCLRLRSYFLNCVQLCLDYLKRTILISQDVGESMKQGHHLCSFLTFIVSHYETGKTRGYITPHIQLSEFMVVNDPSWFSI